MTIVQGDVIFFAAGDPPWWRRTRLGRALYAWRGRRQMRGWTVVGVTDETGRYDYDE